MSTAAYALDPRRYLRSIDASRATLGRGCTKLLDLVARVRTLTRQAPYAVVGGLAQILWARKTHTDDLDVAVASADVTAALRRVRRRTAASGWRLPSPPDRAHEQDDVFEVAHLLYRGAVVDLVAWKKEALTTEIVATARAVPELGGTRFVVPELLLVTHLVRPGPEAALAAVELVVARRARGGVDVEYARKWAGEMGRAPALERTFARADEIEGGA